MIASFEVANTKKLIYKRNILSKKKFKIIIFFPDEIYRFGNLVPMLKLTNTENNINFLFFQLYIV